MQYQEGLVLEIIKRERSLAMSLFEPRELTSTLRHSCQCSVSFPEVGRLCREIITILNKANKKGVLTDEALNNLKKTGHLLWSHVLAHPVRQRLKNAGHIDLTFFLDEELISIPWELLYDGHEFFCLDFNVGRLVRTHVEKVAAAGYRDVANVPRMLILSNPTNDLKSSYSEGMTIRRELDNKRDHIRVDFKSTHIDRMYVRKHLADYDIVHFAGHCEYDPRDQDNTGWLLHDGRFTTSDILSLGSSLTLPTLVFSNGCHSAHASLDLIEADYQQKNYSLASAFLFSGVRHYIGAIRKIEDVISFDFAREFYNQLISGRSVGESLRLSRFKLIRERGMKAILWAGYILYGNPSAVIFPPSPAKKPDSAPRLKPPERRAPGIGVFLRKKLRLRRIAAVGAAVILLSAAYALLPVKNPRVYLRYRKAQNLFNLGRNEEALRHAREIVERHPRFLSIYPILADTYHRLGNKEQALTYYFEYALQSEKQNAPRHLAKAYSSIGWYYHIEGEYEKGRGFYDKAIEISRAHKDRLNEAIALR
ncbi:MAG: CHAT domain-containing protein, partial [Candidatus Omnitrophica bacterium]|nr:CHAT domain-containing protein [Candidatus Omnitrophota bacterium]